MEDTNKNRKTAILSIVPDGVCRNDKLNSVKTMKVIFYYTITIFITFTLR